MYRGYRHLHNRGCGCGYGYRTYGGGFGVGLRRPYRDDFCYPSALTLDAQRQNLEAEKAYLKNRLDFITKALDNIIKDANGENQASE